MELRQREAKCLRAYVDDINDLVYLVLENFTLYGRMLSATHPTLTANPVVWRIYANKVRRYWIQMS
jgi:hypothetical protein